MFALGPGLLPLELSIVVRISWPDFAMTARATLLRTAATHQGVLAMIDVDIAQFGSADDAQLVRGTRCCGVSARLPPTPCVALLMPFLVLRETPH